MKTILTAAQMKAADAKAISLGVPSLVLMERAALSVVQELMHRKQTFDLRRVCIFCGTGNNGGDGVAIGRILKDYGYEAVLILAGNEQKYSEAMNAQVNAAKNRGLRIVHLSELLSTIPDSSSEKSFTGNTQPLPSLLSHATLIIDALFGVGLTRDVTGDFARAIQLMNAAPAPVAAVDLPSGIHTDTGAVMGEAVHCALTVTFAREKRGLLLYPGASYAGEVSVKEIGIPVPEEEVEGTLLRRVEEEDFALLAPRDESGNKGTFGKILVIAGSKEIFGAAALCAEAVLRTGSGMVKVYTEESNRTALAARLPETLIALYKEDEWNCEKDGSRLLEHLRWADGVIIGPGLGTGEVSCKILEALLDYNASEKKPCVMDADALNLLAEHSHLLKKINYPCIFTPHMGEMSRLTGTSIAQLKADPVSAALSYAEEHGVTLVLKDARTVTASPDGEVWINTRGNSALATAGSGDVLSGIAGTILTQNPDLHEAAPLAVLLHAMTGEMASEGNYRGSVLAGDLIRELKVWHR